MVHDLANAFGIGTYLDNLSRHDYATTILTNCVLCTAWYFSMTLAFPMPAGSKRQQEADEFLARMKRPLSAAEQPDQKQVNQKTILIGKMAMFYGVFIGLLLLIPNSLSGRAGILFCSLFIGLSGWLLRWSHLRGRAAAGEPTPPVENDRSELKP